MPRLLYLLRDYPVRSETFIQREVRALERRGWSLRLWSIAAGGIVHATDVGDAPGPPSSTLRLNAAALRPYFRHPQRLMFLLRHGRRLSGLVHEARHADHLHAHFVGPVSDLAALAAPLAGREWSVSVHAWDVFTARPAVLRERLRSARAVVACTADATGTLDRAGIDPCKVVLARHGLPLAEFPLRERAVPAGPICGIGRLVPKKGFDTLIAAVGRLARDAAAPASLVLAGEGAERAALQRLARRAAAGCDISFAGMLDAAGVRELLRRASLLVLPSRRLPDGDRDGLPNVLLEAMAMGVPVVTTRAGAAGEVFRDPDHLRFVPPDQPAALAAVLRDLRERPEPVIARTRRARAQVESLFDLDRAAAPLDRRLREIVGPGRFPSRLPAGRSGPAPAPHPAG